MLGKVRDGALAVTPDMVSLVLAALDRIKAILAGLAATGAEPAGRRRAAGRRAGGRGRRPAPPPAPAPAPLQAPPARVNRAAGA